MQVELKMGKKGQIVIPKIFRKEYHLEPGKTINAKEENGKLVLELQQPLPFSKLAEQISRAGKSVKKLDLHRILDEQYEQKFGRFLK